MFAIITTEEFASYLRGSGISDPGYSSLDQFIEICEVFIAYSAEMVCDSLCVRDFRTNQPKRVDKWEPGKFLPLLAEIPELKFTGVLLPEANGLITD